MRDDVTRLDALRLLLAKHVPCPDDARSGHTYTYPLPAESVRMTPKPVYRWWAA